MRPRQPKSKALDSAVVQHDGAGVGLPKVAFIGTGGTIASIGATPLDLRDYGANGVMMHADEIVARFPELKMVADVIPVRFANVPSTGIYFTEWKALLHRCD